MPHSRPIIWAILSDWGKVVVLFDNHRTSAALAPYTRVFTEPQIHQVLFVERRRQWDDLMRGAVTFGDYAREAKRALWLDCTDAVVHQAFADVFTPNQPIIDLWRDVRANLRTTLVAASNVEEVRHQRMREMGVHDLFHKHCLSYVERVGKPDPCFFQRALEIAGVEAQEALFVDDHPEFCDVARSLGIHAEVYDYERHDDFVRRLRDGYQFV